MMRLARYTRDLMTNVTASVPIRVGREPARQAPELRLVSVSIPGPASRASEASIRRVTEPNRHPYQGGQQENTLCKESRAPLLPPRETVRILKPKTSTRLMSTVHQRSGVFSLGLSLRTHFVGPITPLLLVQGAAVTLLFQDRSQVGRLVSVRTGDGTAHAHITADPFSSFLFFRQWHLNSNPTVPLAVLSKDFTLFAESGPWNRQGAIDTPMQARREVQLANPLYHDPQVKALRSSWDLHLSCVNQFRSECWGFERFACFARGLETSPVVCICASRGTSGILSGSFRRGDAGPFHVRNRLCGNRVQTAEQPRQESQGLSFVARRKKFQLVRQYNLGCHRFNITKREQKTRTPTPGKVERAAVNGMRTALQTPARRHPGRGRLNTATRPTCTPGLRFSGPMQIALALARQCNLVVKRVIQVVALVAILVYAMQVLFGVVLPVPLR